MIAVLLTLALALAACQTAPPVWLLADEPELVT